MKRNRYCEGAEGDGKGGNPSPNPNPNPNPEPNPFEKLKFTPEQQEFVSRIAAEERRNAESRSKKVIEELEKIKAEASTTATAKTQLEEQIKALRNSVLSKEEIAKQEQQKLEDKWQRDLASEKANGEKWKGMFHELSITRALQDGAIDADAWRAQQVVDLLMPKTKLVDEMDANNQPTGRMVPQVKLTEFDKEGKLVEHTLSVTEALKLMKNLPEKYGNLFKSHLAGGLGQNGSVNGSNGRTKPADKMTMDEYLKERAKDPSLGFTK